MENGYSSPSPDSTILIPLVLYTNGPKGKMVLYSSQLQMTQFSQNLSFQIKADLKSVR